MSHNSIDIVPQMRTAMDLSSNDSQLHWSVWFVLMETKHPAQDDQDTMSEALLKPS